MTEIVNGIREKLPDLKQIRFWTGRVDRTTKDCEVISLTPMDGYRMRGYRNETHSYVDSQLLYVPCQSAKNRDVDTDLEGRNKNKLVQTPTANIICKSEVEGLWTPWTKCSKSCDSGEQYRTMTGRDKLTKFQSRKCNVQPCDSRCIERDDLIVPGTYSNRNPIHDCHQVSPNDCLNPKVKMACPLTCKVAGCEKYWLIRDASTEEFISKRW